MQDYQRNQSINGTLTDPVSNLRPEHGIKSRARTKHKLSAPLCTPLALRMRLKWPAFAAVAATAAAFAAQDPGRALLLLEEEEEALLPLLAQLLGALAFTFALAPDAVADPHVPPNDPEGAVAV